MFTWICPQCGREVPPSYSECPNCAENRASGAQPQTTQQPVPPAPAPSAAPPPPLPPQAPPVPQYPTQFYAPPPPPAIQPQPVTPQPSQPMYAPAPPPVTPPAYAAPPPAPPQQMYTVGEQKKGMPTWLVMLGTAAVLGGALFGAYRFLGGGSGGDAKSAVKMEKADLPAGAHPYSKFVEVTGVRMSEDGKKLKVQYLVVNHSAAELAGLQLKVRLGTTAGGEALAEFDGDVGSLGPFSSKEMTASITTKLRAYELPDWQFLKATFEITGPQ